MDTDIHLSGKWQWRDQKVCSTDQTAVHSLWSGIAAFASPEKYASPLSGVSSIPHSHKISKPLRKIELKRDPRKTSSELLKQPRRFYRQELSLGDIPQHFSPPGKVSGKLLRRSEECRYRESYLSNFTSV